MQLSTSALNSVVKKHKDIDPIEFLLDFQKDLEMGASYQTVARTVSRYHGGSRSALARALKRDPAIRKKIIDMVDPEAHHIIPYRDFPDMIEAQQLRNLLERAGISINDASNGVYLERSFHKLTFGNKGRDYVRKLHKEFDSEHIFAIAKTGDTSLLKTKIINKLDDIAKRLNVSDSFWL